MADKSEQNFDSYKNGQLLKETSASYILKPSESLSKPIGWIVLFDSPFYRFNY